MNLRTDALAADFRVVEFQEGQIGPLKTFKLEPVDPCGWANGASVRIGIVDPLLWELFPLGGIVALKIVSVRVERTKADPERA